MTKKTSTFLALTTALAATFTVHTTTAWAQDAASAPSAGPAGIIKQTDTNLCLEPGHQAYDTATVVATHPTIRNCILSGGRRDIRRDTASDVDTTITQPGLEENPTQLPMEPMNPADPMAPMTPPGPMDPMQAMPGVNPDMPMQQPGQVIEMNNVDPEAMLDTLKMMELRDLYGNPISMENITPEALLEMKDMGLLPPDLPVDMLIAAMEEQAQNIVIEEAASTRSGPKEITLPERPSYSEGQGSLFQNPSAYIGRSAQEFLP